ncbi:MAG: 3-deoxy-7-phosphoheptulonate synthase [Spirochaetaceae bacterium]|jgi:3-deoxy-7-phosphoheptulonate synthase|nr:3-deoxy-7-phosphoheptulonate synthase [Spirochaetaceae bacterium]
MIVVLSRDISPHDKDVVRAFLKDHGHDAREQAFGDDLLFSSSGKAPIDIHELSLLPGIERVAAVSKPYELASRETKSEDSIVAVGPVKIGGPRLTVIAGPCAVESRQQIFEIAALVRESGAVMLRGGAFKPRSSPYSFQGLGIKGLEYMKEAGEANGMPIVSEVISGEGAAAMKDLTDMFQIGARNMQNFDLLKKVAAFGKPVLLKRGPSATMEEWLLSAEYLLSGGTKDVVLCERGIRTFETYTRNTLDISAIPVVKGLSHLPVIVDPSHAIGIRSHVSPASLAAVAVGADGLAIEVHNNPDKALSDGPQSLYPEQFEKLMRDIEAFVPVVGKELMRLPKGRGLDEKGAAAAPSAALRIAGGKIAFSGRSGAFAERALINAFGEEAPRLPVPTFSRVFDAVLDGSALFGVIPIENSLAGSVHENYDLFLRYPDVAITGEIKLRIVHCLMAQEETSIERIKTVRSHPQGFAQCREFLDKHPQWNLEIWPTTADAVQSIAGGGTEALSIAAIASEAAAQAHKLTILKAGIENNPQNYTRFVLISRRGEGDAQIVPPAPAGVDAADKASLVFSVKHEPGSLIRCLQILSGEGINLLKLESRPILGQPWNYMFYVDVSIPPERSVFERALQQLKTHSENFRFLGAYRGA